MNLLPSAVIFWNWIYTYFVPFSKNKVKKNNVAAVQEEKKYHTLCFQGALLIAFYSIRSLLPARTAQPFSDKHMSSTNTHLDTKGTDLILDHLTAFIRESKRTQRENKAVTSPLLPLIVLSWWVSEFFSVLSASYYILWWHQIPPLKINVSYLYCLFLMFINESCYLNGHFPKETIPWDILPIKKLWGLMKSIPVQEQATLATPETLGRR